MINFKKQKGFTLIEALVAISLLMTAMASTLSVTQKALSASFISKDQMTASFLAQDALESIKNIRDQVEINSDNSYWLSGLENCLGVNKCVIDSTYLKISSDIGQPLNIESNDQGFVKYDYGAQGTPSKFFRSVNIKIPGDNKDEAEIIVSVSWDAPSGQQIITVSDFIYNYSTHTTN